MGIRFACHHCGRKLNIKRDLAGKRGVCPECEGRFRIPPQDASFSLDAGSGSSADLAVGETAGATATVLQTQIALLDESPDAAWYVRPDAGGQFGPANAAVLAEWIQQGRVSKTSLVWRDGWAQWRDAAEAFADVLDQLPEPVDEPVVAKQVRAEVADKVFVSGIDDVPLQLDGEPTVGRTRGKRMNRRVTSVGVLSGICLALVAVLGYLVWR